MEQHARVRELIFMEYGFEMLLIEKRKKLWTQGSEKMG